MADRASAAFDTAAKFKAVIQCSFMPDEAQKVVGYIATPETLFEMLETLTLTGYEVSARHDPKRKNWSVCIKGVTLNCANAGMWMYGNGDTLLTAHCAAFYKHFVIFRESTWQDRRTDTGSGVS